MIKQSSVVICAFSVCRTKQDLESRVVDQEKELVDARGTITSLRCEKNRLAQHHQKIQVGGADAWLKRAPLASVGYGAVSDTRLSM